MRAHDPKVFRMVALKSALKLEIAGMKRSRGPTAYSMIKRQYGFTGSRQKVLEQLEEHIERSQAS